MSNYLLSRTCKHCGNKITDNNKTGYCVKCYPKYGMLGENNPFFGKKHKKETIDAMKEKCKIASQNKWKDEEYRKHVLDAVVGLKRSETFKKEQSERVKNQMKDKKQREIRSEKLKKAWEDGKMTPITRTSYNTSKQELEFANKLKEHINEVDTKYVIKYISPETKRKRHLFPDIFIPSKNLIIEYHGSFWHADTRMFPDDSTVVHHNITAKELREGTVKRKELCESLGYNYYEIWSLDYLENKDKIVEQTLNFINSL